MPPSREGKQVNFFSLRDQLPKMQKVMPTKNKASISFAVSEDKVQRKKLTFTNRSLMLREKGVQKLA